MNVIQIDGMTIAIPPAMSCILLGGCLFLFSYRLLFIGLICLLLILSTGSPSFCADAALTRETFRELNGSIRNEYRYVQPVQDSTVTEQDPRTGHLSLHVNAWSREDKPDGIHHGDIQGALRYGYFQYARPLNHLHLNIGRQHVSDGVANNARLDGLNLSKRWGSYFSTSLFGGIPPTFAEPTGIQNGLIYGGRIAHHMEDLYEIGLSYQNDEWGTVKAATFLRFNFNNHVAIQGVSDIDPEEGQWREHSYKGKLLMQGLQFDSTYQLFRYGNLYARDRGDNNYFGFLNDGNETVNIIGSDIHSQRLARLKLGVRGRRYHYALRDEVAYYYAGLLTFDMAGGSRISFEAGRMDGETPENNYNIYRGHFYWNNPFNLKAFFSVDGQYTAYDEPVAGKEDTVQLAMGVGYRFWEDRLEVRLSGTYRRDFYTDGVTGGMVTFNVLR